MIHSLTTEAQRPQLKMHRNNKPFCYYYCKISMKQFNKLLALLCLIIFIARHQMIKLYVLILYLEGVRTGEQPAIAASLITPSHPPLPKITA